MKVSCVGDLRQERSNFNLRGLEMKYNDKDWDAGLDPMARIAVAEGLSPGAGAVLRVLRWLPLASADDMAMVVGRKVPGVLADLRKLARAGLVESAQLGCTRAQRQRWYLSAGCLDRAGLSDATWHDEAARCRLLELLPSVEQFYIVVGAVNTLGAFLEFQWLDSLGDEGPSCDAAARYELGWIALFWCGPLVAETHLAERLTPVPTGLPDPGGRSGSAVAKADVLGGSRRMGP